LQTGATRLLVKNGSLMEADRETLRPSPERIQEWFLNLLRKSLRQWILSRRAPLPKWKRATGSIGFPDSVFPTIR